MAKDVFLGQIIDDIDQDGETTVWNKEDKIKPYYSYNERITFCYNYICLDSTEHTFYDNNIPAPVFNAYFKRVNFLSGKSIDELRDLSGKPVIKTSETPTGDDLKLLCKALGETTLKPENTPAIGHFHLFEKADNGLFPVIHFFIGHLSTLHILYLDLTHKIHGYHK